MKAIATKCLHFTSWNMNYDFEKKDHEKNDSKSDDKRGFQKRFLNHQSEWGEHKKNTDPGIEPSSHQIGNFVHVKNLED